MKIRKIEEKDIGRCVEIYNYYILNTFVTLEFDSLSFDSFKNRVISISKNYPYIVLTDDKDFVLGYAYVHEYGERKGYSKTADLSIYIDKDYVGRGLGTLLMKSILEESKKIGLENVVSVVTSKNVNSIKFHEKCGFKEEGNLKNIAHKFGETFDILYLRKSL